jgi:hypothetical protein
MNKMVDPSQRPGRKLLALALVLAGIVAGQFLLYGPSLIGRKVLLPLNFLAFHGCYLPNTLQTPNGDEDPVPSDLVLLFEPDRRFTIREFSAGRFPLWAPAKYGGAPFIFSKYSPFFLFTCLTASPIILAWGQLLAALVAGTGAYIFCRRVLPVGFWPATFVAWCYPMTGFFVFWQGGPTCAPVYWLPWLLLAVDRTVRGNSMAPAALGLSTGLVLVSGQIDMAALVLLVSGLFALWCLYEVHGRQIFRRNVGKAVLILTLGWGLGFLLAAPNLLPVIEYAKTGYRMSQRFNGKQERPPTGLAALPQAVLPDMYGTHKKDSLPMYMSLGEPNLPESSAAAYAGVLATLLAAPLAWCSRRHRSMNVFWTVLAVLGLSWCLDLPVMVHFLRLPGVNMLSYNRLVFATAFAILALTAIGIETLLNGECSWRRWFWLPAALLAGLCFWCIYRAMFLPEPLATGIQKMILAGRDIVVKDIDGLRQIQASFSSYYKISAGWCGTGLMLWFILRFRLLGRRILAPLIGVLLVGDLLWFSHGRNYQCDPALYYPEIPVLRDVAGAAPGRVMGYNCFPANLAQAVGLLDVRGDDAVDPDKWVTLLLMAADGRSRFPGYAVTEWLTPRAEITGASTVQLSPILDMLGVRYLIFRGSPPPNVKPRFQSTDYWVLENVSALPRAFVPQRVEVVPDGRERLDKLARPEFNPREVAYVETPVNLPSPCRGVVKIKNEIPTRITIAAQMDTPGLLVLADLWDQGWQASFDGRPAPILRTDLALRGVVLPAGSSTVEFRYASATVARAFWLAAGALALLLGWLAVAGWRGRTSRTLTMTSEQPDEPDNDAHARPQGDESGGSKG